MKFKVREGFLVTVSEKVEVSDGQFETQTQTFYGGKVVDLTAEQAEEHAHKLEPVDKAADGFLAAKVLPSAVAAAAPAVDIKALIDAAVANALAAAATKQPAA